jgi:hypothetical protein
VYTIEDSEPGSKLLCFPASNCFLKRKGQLQFLDANWSRNTLLSIMEILDDPRHGYKAHGAGSSKSVTFDKPRRFNGLVNKQWGPGSRRLRDRVHSDEHE